MAKPIKVNDRLWLIASWILLLVFSGIQGCTVYQQAAYEGDEKNLYRSYTGSELVRDQIKESFESILRIHNSVNYRTHMFDAENLPTQQEVDAAGVESLSIRTIMDDHSSAGTGIILSNRNGRTTMLTASHTVSFPDTIWHFRNDTSPTEGELVEAVSIKESESHFLFWSEGTVSFEVEVNDPRRDLALMSYRWGREGDPELPPLKISPGDRDELDWTDMIYAIGYPKGIQMVTTGMISDRPISPRRSFVLDASFNRGFSGGPLFSVRNDGTGLEWVGILSAAHADLEYYLAPEYVMDEDYDPEREYTGPVFLRRERRINYGITYAVGIDEVDEFFQENREEIRSVGLRLPEFP